MTVARIRPLGTVCTVQGVEANGRHLLKVGCSRLRLAGVLRPGEGGYSFNVV